MSIAFQREPLTDALWAEIDPLLRAHWAEVAHFKDLPLDPDRDRYRALEALGILRVYTARKHETAVDFFGEPIGEIVGTLSARGGEIIPSPLVGYAAFFVNTNAHYQTSVQAVQDVVYLDPSVRGGTGYKFIAWCDAQLAADGVQATYQHVKAEHNFGKLLERQGYQLVDLIYTKRLDAAKVAAPTDAEELDEAFV